MRERLRLAVPNKGRMVEPTLGLLHDAGLVFEEHDRSLVARVLNHPLDILFVRTGDVIEFVNDGVADAGITGDDILAESGDRPAGADATSGYGRCRLAAAAPSDAPYETIADLAGTRIATSHPNVTRRFFAEPGDPGGGHHPLRGGRGRPAPRASRTRSSTSCRPGSTLAMNGLRPIGDILAVRGGARRRADVRDPARGRARRDRDDAGLRHRGARPQVPDDERAGRVPRGARGAPSRASSRPSVIPLAHAGMIAIHSVVGTDEVWGLLPRLKAAGASGILVLPIEKILP